MNSRRFSKKVPIVKNSSRRLNWSLVPLQKTICSMCHRKKLLSILQQLSVTEYLTLKVSIHLVSQNAIGCLSCTSLCKRDCFKCGYMIFFVFEALAKEKISRWKCPKLDSVHTRPIRRYLVSLNLHIHVEEMMLDRMSYLTECDHVGCCWSL